jgi:hypothetical protein
MFQVVNGSKETIVVDLLDVTGAVTDLSGATPKFSVREEDGTVMVNLASATAVGTRISCLIDTVAVTYTNGLHRLYVSFTIGSEVPLLFAANFHIV